MKKGLCEVTGEKNDVRETQGCMATPTRKCKYEEVRWSLARSMQPHGSLRGCLYFSFSHRWRSQCCIYCDYALQCSHERGMAAW